MSFDLTSYDSLHCPVLRPTCTRLLPRVVPLLLRLRAANVANIAMTSFSFCHWLLKPRPGTAPPRIGAAGRRAALA